MANLYVIGCAFILVNVMVLVAPEGAPCAPAGSVSNVNSSSMVVLWSTPSCPNGSVTGFLVCYEPVYNNSAKICVDSAKNATRTLTSLLPFTNYSISVFGYNSVGNGNAWTSVKATLESTPCAPTGLVANVTDTSMVVSWLAPSCPNGLLMGYFVCYEPVDKSSIQMCFNVLKTATTRVLNSLQPFTNYSIFVFGYTSVGNGSAWTSFSKTSESTPCTPNGSVASVTSTSMVVSWSAMSCPNGILIGYFICWEPLDKSSPQVCFSMLTNTKTRMLSSLRPFTNYSVSLFGYTSVGNGSAWTNVTTTSELTPCAPVGSVANVTNTSMVLSWSVPSCPNGILMGYFTCWEPLDKSSPQVCFSMLTNTTTRMLSSLRPFTNYSVSLFGYTSVGNGSAWTNVIKTSESTPCSPSGLVTEVTSDSMVVSWSAPSCPNGILLGYFVCYESIGRSLERVCFSQSSSVTNRQLSFLLPFTDYNVSVFGFTSVGNGSAWTIVSKTLESTPCAPSGSVAVLTSTSMAVSWAAPSCPNGVLIGYFVCYAVDKSTAQMCLKELKSATNLTLTGLQPFTAYNVSVFGYTSVGNGSAWTIVSTTYEPMPCPPYDLVAAVTNDSVVVSWSAPSCPNGILLGYFVCYESIGKSLERVCFNQASNVTNRKLSFLLPFTDYNVSVFGFTSVGNGSAGTIVSKTLESNPCVPNNISATGVTSTGMTISWRTPSCLNGILLGYNVCYRPEKPDTPLCNSINSTSYVLSQLRPYTMYSISVYAYNSAGRGPAVPWSQQTAAAQPHSSLTIKTLGVPQPYKAFIAWDPVENYWGEILKYQILCSSTKPSFPESVYIVDGNKTSLEITGLSRATSYTLRISACTSAGCGNYTVYEFTTEEDVPLVAGLSVGLVLLALIVVVIITTIILRRQQKCPFGALKNRDYDDFKMTGAQRSRCIKLESLPARVSEMHADSNRQFHDEYEELKALSPKHPCNAASSQENSTKNRYVDVVPFDHSRVKLLPQTDNSGSDYINASYVPGHSSSREFIAAQGPLPGTMKCFWRMIWEQNVSVLVMLTQLLEKGKRKCDQYWPDALNESVVYGDIAVTKTAETPEQPNSTSSDYCIKFFRVSLNGSVRQVTLLWYQAWPDFGCPPTTSALLNFMSIFRSYMTLETKGPATIHCSAGIGQTGTFICLDRILQQILVTDEVDIFGTVLDLRNARARMVQTEDQYIFVHDCVQDFLLHRMSPYCDLANGSSLYANDDRTDYSDLTPNI